MSEENEKEKNIQDKISNLNLESNLDNNNGDPLMATTISSFHLKQNKNNKFNAERKKKYHISFNNTLKSLPSNEVSKINSNSKREIE